MQTGFRTYNLAVELYRDCNQLRVKGAVRDQLERASLSVVLNLSEGAAKPSIKDKRRFYYTAYASLRETQTLLHIINDQPLSKRADQVGAMLYRLIERCK